MKMQLLWIPLVVSGVVQAQWINHPDPSAPRTKDGKVNLSAPAPKLNGKPDFSGVWHVVPTGLKEMKRLFGDGDDITDVPGLETDTISKYALTSWWTMSPAKAQSFRIRRSCS